MKHPSGLFLGAALTLLSTIGVAAQSQLLRNPADLAQFPSIESVRAATKGTDDVDSHARFMAALWRINDMIKEDLVRAPNGGYYSIPPAAQTVQNRYSGAITRYGIDEPPPAARHPRFRELEQKYEKDPAFFDGLLVQFFSPQFRTDYYAWIRKPVPEVTAAPMRSALLFNGYYVHDVPRSDTRRWLRFYEDGTVVGSPVSGGTVEKIAVWLKKGYSSNGRYAVQGSNIGFSIMFKTVKGEDGQTNYSGVIGNGSLRLNWHSLVNGSTGTDDYHFVSLPAAETKVAAVAQQDSGETASAEAVAHYEKGKQLYTANEHEKAIQEFERAIALKLNQDRLLAAHLYLGMSYNHTRQYAKTIERMPRAIAISKEWPSLYHVLADAYERTLQFPKALPLLREAVRLDPTGTTYLSSLGSNLVINGRMAEARDVYSTLLKIDEKEAGYLLDEINNKQGPVGVLVKRAQLGLIGRDREEALEWFNNALRMNPTNIDALFDIGSGLKLYGKYDEALGVFKMVSALNPDTNERGTLHYFVGQVYNRMSDYAKALPELIEANRLNPSYYSKHEIGVTYYETKKFPNALTAFQEAIKFKPKEPDAHIMLGRTYAAMGQPANAIASLRELLKIDPKSVNALVEIGGVNLAANRFPDAGRAYDAALRIDPKNKQALFGIGNTFLAIGRKPEAMRAYAALKPLDEKLAQQLLDEINKR